jgi:hypothetical protein
MNYNVLLTTLEANARVKPIVYAMITKSTLTCTNCGKIGHSMETCHNRKKCVLVVPTATIRSIKPIARTKIQPVKSGKVNFCYPCIICSSIKHG